MIHFAHAKINLGLSVVSRRADGFHDIETIFYPVPLHDVVEILPAASLSLETSGLAIPGRPEDNLLTRAWQQVKLLRPSLPAVKILLHKAIPMGAGLGGGSSDAAGCLLMLNDLFSLGLTGTELSSLAASLGSDCGFFLRQQPCIGSGRGEILEPVSIDLSAYDLLLVHPTVSVSTAWAYSRIVPSPSSIPMKKLATLPPSAWKDSMFNAFEAPVFEAHPELEAIKTGMYSAGAVYAAMTGSGSTFFGLFHHGACPAMLFGGQYPQRLIPGLPGRPVW